MRLLCFFLMLGSMLLAKNRPNNLVMYFVDVSGGQATLLVTPEGESVLIGAARSSTDEADASRIAAVAKLAKLKRIDYFVITSPSDHPGGASQFVQNIPIGTFVDGVAGSARREEALGPQHLLAKAGDDLPIKGLDATVISAGGGLLKKPLPTGGNLNTFCSATPAKPEANAADAQTLGTFWHFGRFRMLNLGDLPWQKELELVCPTNRLGKIDLFVVSHRGSDVSNSPALVRDITPRVAIVENDAGRGGAAATYNTLKTVSGLEDIWQLHYSEDGGKEHNTVETKIANVGDENRGYYLRVTASEDGSFEVYNARNKYSQKYEAKGAFGRLGWETR
jgi:competence protein ComEC